MRIRIFFALIPLLLVAAVAQDRPAMPPGVYRIHKLTLISNDLPGTERDRIARAFQGGTYNVDELAERIRFRLRDTGYALSEVGVPQITRVRPAQSACNADVRFAVQTGAQYRFGGITFTAGPGDSVFASAQLRAQFPLEDGAIFNATAIGKGLEKLKDLYGSAGYANFGAIPKPDYDKTRHIVRLTIDMDQGRTVNFGKLLFEGIEPRAGVAQAMLAAWEELQGKRYNSQLLREWLKTNSALWPSDTAKQVFTSYVASADPGTLNVLIQFP